MGRIPADEIERIRSRSTEVRHLEDKLENAHAQLEWTVVQHQKDPSDVELRADVADAERNVRFAQDAVNDEIDFEYRSEIVRALEVPEGYLTGVGRAFMVSGPWGSPRFDVESQAGQKLAAYLGVDPSTLLNYREKTSADHMLASRGEREEAISHTAWAKTSDWISDVLWEQRRRQQDKFDSFARRMEAGPRKAATWAPPRISFLNTMFMPHMTMLDSAPPCPQCRTLLLPMNPDKNYVYCGHCAQGYRMFTARDQVELAALHYDCPGCGKLHGVPEAGRPSACGFCGVLPAVSTRTGGASYADPKQEKKDSGKGLFADKKRSAQLQKWRQDNGGRVATAREGLDERFAEWETDFIWTVERLPLENGIGWHLYKDDLLALTRYSFTVPPEEDLPRLQHEFHQQRLADLETELMAKYEWGVPSSDVPTLVKQHPWAKNLIERLSRL